MTAVAAATQNNDEWGTYITKMILKEKFFIRPDSHWVALSLSTKNSACELDEKSWSTMIIQWEYSISWAEHELEKLEYIFLVTVPSLIVMAEQKIYSTSHRSLMEV